MAEVGRAMPTCGASEASAGADAKMLASQVIHQVLRTLAHSGDSIKASATGGADARGAGAKEAKLEVRWMASGNKACDMPVTPKMRVADVKVQVQERAGIPVSEQRIFAGPQELPEDAAAAGKNGSSLMLVRSISDPRTTNLGHFRVPMDFGALPQGAFAMVRQIQNSVYEYHWQSGLEEQVAVKMFQKAAMEKQLGTETDERSIHMEPWNNAPHAEDALTEIGIFAYLSRQPDLPEYLLRMLGCFSSDGLVWLVTEFAEGGDLFDVVISKYIPEEQARRYSWQLLQAVTYLHHHCICHRDISLENILLKDGSIKIMDFAMAVQTRSVSGTVLRYFEPVGKNNYRAPEMYVPAKPEIGLVAPVTSAAGDVVMTKYQHTDLIEVRMPPDTVPGKFCSADVWGYAASPVDVFSAGICLFIMHYQCPAWVCARLHDPCFSYVYSHGMENGLKLMLHQHKKPLLSPDAMQVLTSMLQPNPCERPSAVDCLKNPWFKMMSTF